MLARPAVTPSGESVIPFGIRYSLATSSPHRTLQPRRQISATRWASGMGYLTRRGMYRSRLISMFMR